MRCELEDRQCENCGHRHYDSCHDESTCDKGHSVYDYQQSGVICDDWECWYKTRSSRLEDEHTQLREQLAAMTELYKGEKLLRQAAERLVTR